MTLIFKTNTRSKMFEPREFLSRVLARQMPAVKAAFLLDGALRDEAYYTINKRTNTITISIKDQ